MEYAIKDDDERRSGYSPDRSRGRSPRKSYGRGRSPSPYGRERASPDYGHGHNRSRSPYRRERASPDYGRPSSPGQHGRGRNSEYARGHSHSLSPRKDTNRNHGRSPSPQKERLRSDNGHKSSPRVRTSADYERRSDRSPPVEKRQRSSPDGYDRDRSPSPNPEAMDVPGYGGEESPLPDRYRRFASSLTLFILLIFFNTLYIL